MNKKRQKKKMHKGKHSPREAVITYGVQATTASVSPTETLIKPHASRETKHENSTSPSSPEMQPACGSNGCAVFFSIRNFSITPLPKSDG